MFTNMRGMARNFSKSQSLYREGGSLPLGAYVLFTHGSCLGKSPPQTLALLRPTAVSQQEEFGAYMEETKEWHLATLGASPTSSNRRKGKPNIFSNPRACIEAELSIFPSPRAQEEARAWNFSKSQRPYKGREFGIFPSPRYYMKRLYEGGARNFSKSQGPYRYRSAKSNILTYWDGLCPRTYEPLDIVEKIQGT